VNRLLVAIALVLISSSIVAAGPLADALARHADRDVTALRDRRGDVAARCTLGAVYAKRSDLTRAALYLRGCDDASLPDDIAPAIAKIDRELAKRLRDSDLAQIEVVTDGAMTGRIDALPDDSFTTPATLFLRPGDYKVEATAGGIVVTNVIHAVKRSRGVVVLEGAAHPATTHKDPKPIDFTEDPGASMQHVGQPKDVQHGNMMPIKYQRGMGITEVEPDAPGQIADPLARSQLVAHAPRTYWLGLRLGGGMFDDGAAAARVGVSVAGAIRYPLSGRTFLAGRLDWSRRGGTTQGIDSLGASAGVGASVIDDRALGLALLAQVRGDLRLADSRTVDTMTLPVSRAGAAVAVGVELALPRTPFSAGLRFEQGLTQLVPGARDRAVLFELGIDLR